MNSHMKENAFNLTSRYGLIVLFGLFSLAFSPLTANDPCTDDNCDYCIEECNRQLTNYVYIGPEAYRVRREKEGGTKQSGTLWGVRLGYDRIKRYGWYIGADYLFAKGTLKGHSGNDRPLKSTLTDQSVEGRLGYTFQKKTGCNLSFTPFAGIGNFWETNKYQHPSPLHVQFNNNFLYIPVGFLSHVYVTDIFGVGLNFKARLIVHHNNKVKNDPEYGAMKLHYEEKTQYRVEVPLTYDISFCDQFWRINLVPFYEYRHYGSLANFPFDFIDTKLKIFGANLQFELLF